MFRKRWVGWGLVGLLLAAMTLAFWPLSPGITRANCERIQEGMTLAEVESILGGPPRSDVPNNPDVRTFIGLNLALASGPGGPEVKMWFGGSLGIAVTFDANQRVTRKERFQLPEPGFLDRLRDWLGL
jgi:hypothetical protein